jgi:5-methylcytosine-specific restriction endonuclease McrA
MLISETQLRLIIRRILIEKGGRHQFHGAGDAETLTQYKNVPGPMFGKGKGSVAKPITSAPEEIVAAEDYLDLEKPDELIAYSRGGAMVQELEDDHYQKIKKIKYIAPAVKRGWTNKQAKLAPSGSEAYADSGDSLVSLIQVAQLAKEAGIAIVKIYHDPNMASTIGKPTGRKGKDGEEKMSHWRGVGIGKHQTAVDKGITNDLDGSDLIKIPTDKILQAANSKELTDWKTGRSKPEEVEQQWAWVNDTINESIIRNVVREIIYEKKSKKKKREVKCPLLPNGKRDYKCEYQKYGGASKKGKKERATRNKARKQAEKLGLVRKGDGMELDHIMPLSLGGSNDQTNWQIMSRADNRKKGKKWNGKTGSKAK